MSMLGSADTTQTEAQLGLWPKSSPLAALLYFVRRYPLGALGGAILLALILTAIFAPWIAPHDPQETSVALQYAPPGSARILGGDQLGRDVLSRLIYGARISLSVSLLSVGIGVTAGTLIGIFSAYAGGTVDLVVQRLVDALMAFPPIILALGLMAALGASMSNVVIALSSYCSLAPPGSFVRRH